MPTIKTENYKVEVDREFSVLDKYLHAQKASRIFVIVDENTKTHCLPILHDNIGIAYELLEVKSSEENKTLETSTWLWNQLIEKKCDRSSLIINLGGGVIGDMGGFVAATYMRGIKFIQMPTTLLSQVDASIGGKLGVDHLGYKNIVGLFQNPSMVWIHTPFLKTLEEREMMSGFAEVIKHSLISNKSMWERIKINGTDVSDSDWTNLVSQSVKIKNKVVAEDPKEAGYRKILNFGHTIGHAIESYFLNTEEPLRHGEAVAKGMIAEAYLAFKTKRITIIEMEEINSLLESIYDLPSIPKADMDKILALMTMDKKNKDGFIRFSLLSGIGNCDYDVEVDSKLIRESLSF